ncbi:YeiH family protein [Capnocytophaga cynodegmi]|uniref:Sulfate exporter family transporter n=1 Tax=Capnocytophaga cynodegmi TaxID=28189 RepID=A0A0B7GZR9_9FLAO|nr:putative sulfate exporter family transporter [Capnocytophaga cynodegmi]CEN32781.1 conserved membrane hypothetical protein [Capnocytophaga cynodegmi]
MQINNIKLHNVFFIFFCCLCLTPWISSPVALLLGFFWALFFKNSFQNQLNKYIHLLLKIAVIGLGFGLKLDEALQAGSSGFLLTIGSILFVLVGGHFLGKLLKLGNILSFLLSVGTAICGGSAIAAVTPIVNPKGRDVSIALAIIFTLNSLALLIYPIIGQWLNLSQQEFGLWCAIGIHDTSSVVGTAGKFGDEALKIATIVKLARALWIIPLCFLTMFLFKSNNSKIKIPWFIITFVLAIVVNTYFPIFNSVNKEITLVSKSILHLTLFLIGATLTREKLRTIGLRPLLFAVILWVMISFGSLEIIRNGLY